MEVRIRALYPVSCAPFLSWRLAWKTHAIETFAQLYYQELYQFGRDWINSKALVLGWISGGLFGVDPIGSDFVWTRSDLIGTGNSEGAGLEIRTDGRVREV